MDCACVGIVFALGAALSFAALCAIVMWQEIVEQMRRN